MGFGDAMLKYILITGATDGLGLEAAKLMAGEGHTLLLHGRSKAKLQKAKKSVSAVPGAGPVEVYVADLSRLDDVEKMAEAVSKRHEKVDVLINNAGVFKTSEPTAPDGRDVRFVVNSLAPYLLTKRLLPLIPGDSGRVVNMSSAAQQTVNPAGLMGPVRLDEFSAYAQSKLAIAMWSNHLASELGESSGPAFIALNPGSMLGTKMVKEGFGVGGKDMGIGADIIARAALSDEFAAANGKYWDNDRGGFAYLHPDAMDPRKCKTIADVMEKAVSSKSGRGRGI